MGIRRLSTASISTGVKSSKFWDQSTAISNNSYESIATAIVGAGGATSVSFTSIPQTYTHLEVRATMLNASNFYTVKLRFNSDTGANYPTSQLVSFNATSFSGSGPDADTGAMIGIGARNVTSYSSAIVAKIYEYSKTNLYKRWVGQGGVDGNGTGQTKVSYGYWANQNAITNIYCYADGSTMNEYTQFALYGIKGA
jgi:hypothetical protein